MRKLVKTTVAILALIGLNCTTQTGEQASLQSSPLQRADDPYYWTSTSDRERWSEKSSLRPCQCWPDGDSCILPGARNVSADAGMRCPEAEVCTGPEVPLVSAPGGYCGKPCFHPKVKDSAAFDCAGDEMCRHFEMRWGFEGQHRKDIAVCWPIQVDPGDSFEVQHDGQAGLPR